MPRYVVLEHTGAPDDPRGCHLDWLLEDGDHCRTWRLDHWPTIDGEALTATPLPPHRLVWLDRQSAAVSGGRGWARRLAGGDYVGTLPLDPADPVEIVLSGLHHRGWPNRVLLRIEAGHCCLCSCP
ncbi:MAG: hypothetical protein ACON4T_02565 [Synechococcus sp.]